MSYRNFVFWVWFSWHLPSPPFSRAAIPTARLFFCASSPSVRYGNFDFCSVVLTFRVRACVWVLVARAPRFRRLRTQWCVENRRWARRLRDVGIVGFRPRMESRKVDHVTCVRDVVHGVEDRKGFPEWCRAPKLSAARMSYGWMKFRGWDGMKCERFKLHPSVTHS